MTEPKKLRGFAAMTPEQRKQIATMGGKASHLSGRAHTFKRGKEAVEAGRKGGIANAARVKSGFKPNEQKHKINGS